MKLYSLALCIAIHDNKVLLLKRNKEPFKGMWALPGGKIEHHEHVKDAAMRELFEETKVKSNFVKHLGVISEHLIEEGKENVHFVDHVCHLQPDPETVEHATDGGEGEVQWFDIDEVMKMDNIIPSDPAMIKKMLQEQQHGYHHSIIKKDGDKYSLELFEKVDGKSL